MGQFKKKLLMIKRWSRILTGKSVTAVAQKEGTCFSVDKIKGYYNNLTGKVSSGTLLDDNGIPLTQISENEYVHFPIAVFQYGLGCYDLYLTTNKTNYLESFKKVCEWAVNQLREDVKAYFAD